MNRILVLAVVVAAVAAEGGMAELKSITGDAPYTGPGNAPAVLPQPMGFWGRPRYYPGMPSQFGPGGWYSGDGGRFSSLSGGPYGMRPGFTPSTPDSAFFAPQPFRERSPSFPSSSFSPSFPSSPSSFPSSSFSPSFPSSPSSFPSSSFSPSFPSSPSSFPSSSSSSSSFNADSSMEHMEKENLMLGALTVLGSLINPSSQSAPAPSVRSLPDSAPSSSAFSSFPSSFSTPSSSSSSRGSSLSAATGGGFYKGKGNDFGR